MQTIAQAAGGRLAAAALYAATVAVYADMYITQPILPLISAEYGVAPATAGLTVSAVVSPLAGRLSARVPRRALIAAGLLVAMLGVAGTLAPAAPLIVASLFVLCAGMFTAQAVAPAYANAAARGAKGGGSALYLMFYYAGGTLGAAHPGLAWQTAAWPGVVGVRLAALGAALLSNWLLCRE